MIKDHLVDAIVAAARVPRSQALLAVETILDAMRRALAHGGRVELRGFGTLVVKPRRKGFGRNPRRPSEEIPIRGFTVRLRPGRALRDM